MALKRKINKSEFDALPEAVRGEYKIEGMDYVLDLEGYEDPGELKRAKDREAQRARDEKARADAAEAQRDALEAQLNDGSEASARRRGDIATLEKSWQSKIDVAKAEGTKAVEKLKAAFKKTVVGQMAEALAKDVCTVPSLMLPHITSRLDVDFSGDEPTVRILGPDSKPSALTMKELREEIVANKEFAAIIVGSKASGGGAAGGTQGGGGAPKELAKMNSQERAAFQKSDPEGFKQAVAAQPQTVRL